LPKPNAIVVIQAVQRRALMAKQPNSRICFLCGVDKPIGLHLAFCADDEGGWIARFEP